MKNKKHNKVVRDFEIQKAKHLEKLATELLKRDEQNQKLKSKTICTDFLNLF